MNWRIWTIGVCIAMAGVARAEDKPAEQPGEDLRLYLMEGSVVTGTLSVKSITVTTEFGKLEVPVESIRSFTPGLDSHPNESKRIARLIEQLGANSASDREEAQKQLSALGPTIRSQLQAHAKSDEAERRKRIQQLLTELDEQVEDTEGNAPVPLIAEDRVETTQFTVVGKISPQSFEVQTQFGPLAVPLADIRSARREIQRKSELRKTVSVTGTELVQFNFRDSLRVERGDTVVVKATGTLVMAPWGSNSISTPQGDARYQWYVPNKIPGGALVARIGSSGEIFMVGNELSFTATRTGQLSFAIAMNPQYANQGYSFPGEYSVKVHVNPE